MIEINLLPPQYRTVEKTPLPIFLGLIGGLVVVAAMGLFLLHLVNQGRALDEHKNQLASRRDKMKTEVDEIEKIKKELSESKGRVETLLGIAESKVYWSLKLLELVKILPRDVWLDRIDFDGTKLTLATRARGTGVQRYTFLRQQLRNDTNFIYNFDPIPITNVDVVSPGKEYTEPAVLSFTMPITLRAPEQAKK